MNSTLGYDEPKVHGRTSWHPGLWLGTSHMGRGLRGADSQVLQGWRPWGPWRGTRGPWTPNQRRPQRSPSLLSVQVNRGVRITSLPRSKHFLISWLQSSSAVIRFLQMTSSELVCFWKTCKIVSSLCSSPTLGLLYSSHSIRVMIQESELRTQTQTTK